MVSGYAIATLVLFILSIIFVIQPAYIPLPRTRWRIPINLTTAPILAIAILWAAQCIDPYVIRTGIVGSDGVKPYNILILFFSLAYMAITLDITGILQSAAFWVSNKGGDNGWRLYLYFYLMLTFLSICLGNDPVILSGTVFLVYFTQAANLNPDAWLMSEFAAANTASMVLFVGNPTNVVICEGFNLNNAAFTAYTILPFLACNFLCFLALAAQFHDKKYLPRTLPHKEMLNVRAALIDPVSAVVGSVLLGSALIICILTSFFGVDVWEISLPFAVAKFVWDICWDFYRGQTGKPMLGRGLQPVDTKAALVHDTNNDDAKDAESRRTSQPPSVEKPPISVANDEQASEKAPSDRSPTDTLGDASRTRTLVNEKGAPRSTSPSPARTSEKTAAADEPQTLLARTSARLDAWYGRGLYHFPTFFTALPRLPFALVPFAFSQFILIEALAHQGWIEIFARWLVIASEREMYAVVWLVGVLGVLLCNFAGTNIGATILLTEIVRAAELEPSVFRGAAIALAVASNIGAVSFTFSASLAGLLWRGILGQKGIKFTQRRFAVWNLFPLLVMTIAGLAVVSAEMAVLY
ncbi:hypothetical protein CONPUDRAFT_111819 [Coniophora puteana RWD-64-598 SS2]|uniref:Citrate transporter-like domain-containing protein n=1 Tax=Coniophora puteana (strain RWD-64-598) TaxID=741705 RepID=A0A5M3M9V9_CONPW|nr:uncharacterized protein CONPUDRAFT_111819 [Coniophora puteana RWD-64-598 SS2]EIW75979.1 hypothetical protein CONPUDRAFT_111819 [Coniophora puteana RWD-64-598 SS2]